MNDLEKSIEGLPKHDYGFLDDPSPLFRVVLVIVFIAITGIVFCSTFGGA